MTVTNTPMAMWGARLGPGAPGVRANPTTAIGSAQERYQRRLEKFPGFGCSDAGVGLMRVESDVMVDVTRKLLADGVAILPVHDAAIVQARHYGLAEAAMVEAFERRTGVAGGTVRRKG